MMRVIHTGKFNVQIAYALYTLQMKMAQVVSLVKCALAAKTNKTNPVLSVVNNPQWVNTVATIPVSGTLATSLR